MIATLTGKVSEKLFDEVVIDVNGVGYGAYVTQEDAVRLELDTEVKLYIYEHVREQAHDLFGFIEVDTQQLFEKLLEVSGVGPKMALSMLSIGQAKALKQAIASGDTSFIQQASGVGKRLAERVVVELKDKVGLLGVDLKTAGLLSSNQTLQQDEAIQALTTLGFNSADAMQALKDVDTNLPLEERVRLALKQVSKWPFQISS